MIGLDGRAVITDFGIAKIIDDSYRRKIDVTVTMVYKDGSEVRLGKDRYMAPELKKLGGGEVSFASDAWALGVLLFRMLSGSWYDEGTRLDDWHADYEYDWHPIIAQLCNVDPLLRIGEGGIAALPSMVKRKGRLVPFWRQEWVVWCAIAGIFPILAFLGTYIAKRAILQDADENRYDDFEKYEIANWEMISTEMPRLIVPESLSDNTNISQTIVWLTELARSNLWATTLHFDLGLPDKEWQDSDIHLTIDPNIQSVAESAVKRGLDEYGATMGWAIVMDAKTGAIYAMVSCPDSDPVDGSSVSDFGRINQAIGFSYEPGSVIKVLTVAGAIDSSGGFLRPNTRYNTNRDDPAYSRYRLPGDGANVWEPTMTVKDAIVKSSNIVVGKIGCDWNPKRLFASFRRFGLGEKTGIELPGEMYGILPDPNKRMWDMLFWWDYSMKLAGRRYPADRSFSILPIDDTELMPLDELGIAGWGMGGTDDCPVVFIQKLAFSGDFGLHKELQSKLGATYGGRTTVCEEEVANSVLRVEIDDWREGDHLLYTYRKLFVAGSVIYQVSGQTQMHTKERDRAKLKAVVDSFKLRK